MKKPTENIELKRKILAPLGLTAEQEDEVMSFVRGVCERELEKTILNKKNNKSK